ELKESLKRMKKIKVGNGHIYLGKNDIGFAEYETFQIGGLQDSETFAKGGLARIIEHTKGPAIKLELISALSNYPRGISVEGFESSRVPIERVLNLSWESDWSVGGSRLYVNDISRGSGGYAFGVRK
ncbi:MAG TPA: hypothetical protein VJH20_04500, partial [Candidatus Nanoarchaeia archaeon]|nr:hypothetical protein [Candidatus Nanoarchaeia archaeon]